MDLFEPDGPPSWVEVAVERGLSLDADVLTYAVPSELHPIALGSRVRVPLGRGATPTAGWVVAQGTAPKLAPERIKRVIDVDDRVTPLPESLIEVSRWVSDYYQCPMGMTLASVVPAAVKRGTGRTLNRHWSRSSTPQPDRLPPAQRRILEVLDNHPGPDPLPESALLEAARVKTRGPLQALERAGLVEVTLVEAIRGTDIPGGLGPRRPDWLTGEQQRVIQSVGEALSGGASVHVLHGVTGSGKTEVYLQLIEQVLAAGKTALMLVPEIALTPQTGARLSGRFPDHRVAILHSGLHASQRHAEWQAVRSGDARVILGARSAVFAPVCERELGLVVVDEEHESSYKQEQAPRYHGRDLAILRAHRAECPIILGSATPSMETWSKAVSGRWHLHRMRSRPPGMALPRVEVVDLAQEEKSSHDRSLGTTLMQGLHEVTQAGDQAIVLLNRRGWASWIGCSSQTCGYTLRCEACEASMVMHRDRRLPQGGHVKCHHCLRANRLPSTCPDCGKGLIKLGLGTQRLEEVLREELPHLDAHQIVRVDSDQISGLQDLHEILGAFGRREIRVLLGTQMIAKGLDFPGVRLVGVVSADTALQLPDFRASERTFQLVSQVAGRAGRTADGPQARVIVQSMHPDNPAVLHAAAHEWDRFAEHELAMRAGAGLPPVKRMARIVFRDRDLDAAMAMANAAAQALSNTNEEIELLGPAPCPMARIDDRHRIGLEVLGETPGTLGRALAKARVAGGLKPGEKVVIDVDPTTLL